ncbi:hypothetical protein H257_13807 [Aphanomyces astaci]|uniref:WRKY19-like zinc finger domain-containing protein n=1 Tax=Aphanomyces astaci TaxID=112090 RepID=W4FV82_APHAT|nr:hypothetical protein H257_13807 [Aphanomyces astaci]ETV70709.1 hypothetical protein H257_13807 [Aphanomyces astaci]|eukprot:XP_009839773.1 hypothetical protein H257_13807 [Aphanomyces astaci]
MPTLRFRVNITPMTGLKALSQDREIMDLLSTVFSQEFHYGTYESSTTITPFAVKSELCLVPPQPTVSDHSNDHSNDGNVHSSNSHNDPSPKRHCVRHGKGKRCRVEDCTSSVKLYGVCWKHGGSRLCQREGCNNHSKSRGLCWSHGGGKKCETPGCKKTGLRGGHCWAHGGGKRCRMQGCQQPAYERNDNLCYRHCDTGV